MRWRCAAGIFHRSAVFSRRTSALLHLTIRSPESDGPSESHLKRGIQPVQAVSCIIRIEPIHAVMELVLECSTVLAAVDLVGLKTARAAFRMGVLTPRRVARSTR